MKSSCSPAIPDAPGIRFSRSVAWLLACASLLPACSRLTDAPAPAGGADPPASISDPPAWAREAVWYQIFVERFRNGDPSNDPAPADIEGSYPGFVPAGWRITPWTQDWYEPDDYFSELEGRTDAAGNPISSFGQKVQLRRYGGDLQGVMDKLDYLDSLGVTAIYFNPLNDAPSLHKYDARNWRHIDRNFGPSPGKDAEIMAREIPDDPATWVMTGADALFVDLIAALHDRGIRVLLDYSWNHTGQTHWAIRDVQARGAASRYADWYWIESFDDPDTPEDEFAYQGWLGVAELPEIRETVHLDHTQRLRAYEGNIYSETAKRHIFNVTKRWLDPDGDGDPSDGVDGFRLDVAAEIGLGFWREYRSFVRAINPEALLLGEVWWASWPDELLDPAPFLEGDVFDSVMNYRWYRAARHFFAAAPDAMPASAFVDSLRRLNSGLRPQNNDAMMNLAASHDAPRVATSFFNKNRYKYLTSPEQDPGYKIHRPDADTYRTLRLLLAHQFTYVGAPHIWAGDEMGMWGADDPSTRKPLVWPDYDFDPETAHPLGRDRPVNPVAFDEDLFAEYRKLIRIRKEHPALSRGGLAFVLVDDAGGTLAYSRSLGNEEVLAVFNASLSVQRVKLPVKTEGIYRDELGGAQVVRTGDDAIETTLEARSAAILSNRRAR